MGDKAIDREFHPHSPRYNGARGHDIRIKDYRELSLKDLEEKYGTAWLEQMKERYLLEDYFEGNSNEVIIFKGYKLENPTFNSLKDLMKFLELTNKRIIRRGKKVFKKLRMLNVKL